MDFNINDLFFYSGAVPSPEEYEGKELYPTCCEPTCHILEGLKPFNPTREEFEIFKDAFSKPHAFKLLNLRKMVDSDYETDEFFDEISQMIQPIESRELRQYFFECLEKETKFESETQMRRGNNVLQTKKFLRKYNELKELLLSDKVEDLPFAAPYASFIHLSQNRGAKTNFLRVLDALWELRYFTDETGQIVTKERLMKTFGEFLGDDFSTFASDLSQSYIHTSLETNVAIFDEMKQKIQEKVIKKT